MRWLGVLVLLAGCEKLLGFGHVAPDPDASFDAPPDALPPGNWVAVAAGFGHTCGIEASDHSLWCWGRNVRGELGIGSNVTEVDPPTKVGSARWAAIAGTSTSTCALGEDQTLWCWGENAYGQAGSGMPTELQPVQIPGSWLAIAIGSFHACGIRSDHSIACWGYNQFGELGADPKVVTQSATPLPVPGNWTAIAVGEQSSCAIDSTGTVQCWGYNGFGQLGDGTTVAHTLPVPIGTSGTFVSLAAGAHHTCAVRDDGHMRCWGLNNYGQLGNSTTTSVLLPAKVGDDIDTWKAVAAGTNHTCAVRTDSSLWCWGDNRHGELGIPRILALASTPAEVDVGHVAFIGLSLGMRHTCALSDDHNLWCAGGDGYGQLGDLPTHRTPVQVPGMWTAPTASTLETCAQDPAGALWCWGNNDSGQIGDGTYLPRSTPVMVAGGTRTLVAVGGNVVCEMRNGARWCWGENYSGEFADGTTSQGSLIPRMLTSSPPPVKLRISQTSVIFGYTPHVCALDAAGALTCWGGNGANEVASTSTMPVLSPFAEMTGVSDVGVGVGHTCVITGATVQCWGYNQYGELGNGQTTSSSTPVTTATLPIGAPTALVVSAADSCALDATGAAACWGYNGYGDLGLGNYSQVLAPTLIPNKWRSLAIGDTYGCGVATDRTLWCWGNNERGQLGDGTASPSPAQKQVGTDTDWDVVVSARAHSCATKTDRRMFCWGENTDGELGDGTGWRNSFAIVPAP